MYHLEFHGLFGQTEEDNINVLLAKLPQELPTDTLEKVTYSFCPESVITLGKKMGNTFVRLYAKDISKTGISSTIISALEEMGMTVQLIPTDFI